MKNLIFLFFAFMLFNFALAQAPPQAMSFSAVAKGSNGQMLANKIIGLRFSIIAGSMNGTVVFQETQTDTTDQNGIFACAIGFGTSVQGTFDNIDWGGNTHYLKVELDENGGANYFDMGITQLLSVPYALYAENAGSVPQGISQAFNPEYPDGQDSITPLNSEITSGIPYTVPTGMNLHCYMAESQQTTNSINIGTETLYSWSYKGLLAQGTTISTSSTTFISLNGYLAPALITPIVINTSTLPYTVPSGKTLYIVHVDKNYTISGIILIDGFKTYNCYPGSCNPSPKTLMAGAGSVISSTFNGQALIFGYLK